MDDLTGTFKSIVHKGCKLPWPCAETPNWFMSMVFSKDLKKGTALAPKDMLNFLVAEKNPSRDDTCMLARVAVDLNITQRVDGKVGVHAICPRKIFTASSPRR